MDLRSTDALTAGIQYRSYESRKHGLSYRALLAFERFARGITHSERTDPALRTHPNRLAEERGISLNTIKTQMKA
jgi:hypothetical protein